MTLNGMLQTGGVGLLLGQITQERLNAVVESAKPAQILICQIGDPLQPAGAAELSAKGALLNNVSAAELDQRLAALGQRLDWACLFAGQSSLAESMNALESVAARLSASANVLILTDSAQRPQLSGFAECSCDQLGPAGFVHRLRRPFPNKATVFSYWQNPRGVAKRAEYLDLCRDTVLRNLDGALEHVEVTEKTIKEFLPDVRDDVALLPTIAHRADYYRALLVHRYGGYWLDRDCILTTSLAQCQRDLESSRSDFIAVGRPGPRPSIGFFGGLADCCLLRRYIKGMDDTLNASQGKGLGWTALGYSILWPISVTYRFHQYEFTQGALVAPGTPKRFFEQGPASSFPEMEKLSKCVLVFLYNAQFPSSFTRLSAAEIMGSDMLIAHLFRAALEPARAR